MKNKVEHCGITYKDDVYDIDGKEMFPTLSAMIQYMMKFDGLRKKDGSWIRFIHPLYADVTPDETCVIQNNTTTGEHIFNLFTTILDGNFRRHSSMNVTIK